MSHSVTSETAPISEDVRWMRRALEVARLGEGSVEPNPMVGCVIVKDGKLIAEGWHGHFGGPHAEIEALRKAGSNAKGSTLYVTLEPCCHYGKTPPCTEAILPSGIRRVVVAMRDPFPKVSGGGIRQLSDAGILVDVGICEAEAAKLCRPYLHLIQHHRPWVMAKWAMTLDGKIATRASSSRWISGAKSRAIVHQLRGRVDAIMVGRQTAEVDDPMLTARPEELAALPELSALATTGFPRVATRIVIDSKARLSLNSKLVKTAKQIPTLIAVGPEADESHIRRLSSAGCEVLPFVAETYYERHLQLLEELGRRKMTNVLVEGGSQLLGGLFDGGLIDEVHVFVAPKLIGGQKAPSPIAGAGIAQMQNALTLGDFEANRLDDDLYLRGTINR